MRSPRWNTATTATDTLTITTTTTSSAGHRRIPRRRRHLCRCRRAYPPPPLPHNPPPRLRQGCRCEASFCGRIDRVLNHANRHHAAVGVVCARARFPPRTHASGTASTSACVRPFSSPRALFFERERESRRRGARYLLLPQKKKTTAEATRVFLLFLNFRECSVAFFFFVSCGREVSL